MAEEFALGFVESEESFGGPLAGEREEHKVNSEHFLGLPFVSANGRERN
jgi:hypothetical protein